MAIRVECIFCNSQLTVHDRFAGREIRCPQCNNRFGIPKPGDANQSTAPKRSSDSPEPSPPLLAHPGDAREFARGDERSAFPQDSPEGESDLLPPLKERHVARTEEEELEWDVTPMVDVAFLLLIFFMITASFSIQKAIPMAPPQEDAPGQSSTVRETQRFREIVTLQIDEFNGFTLIGSDGSESVSSSKQELITQLEELQIEQASDSVKLMVLAHKMSNHGALVAGLDAARKAGFINFQVQAVEEF